MYNNHDLDQVNVYENRQAEAQSFEQMASDNARGTSGNSYNDDDKKKDRNSQKADNRSESGQKSHEVSRNSSTNVSPATIEHALKGMKYPADKKTLMEQARSNSASEDVMDILNRFEEKEYSGVVEVNKEIGNVDSNKTSRSSEQNSTHSARGSSGNSQQSDTRSDSEQNSREGSQSRSTNVSPATIEHALKGMKYPADKKMLIAQAQSNSASEDVMDILNQFEEKEYNGVVDVNKEIGKVESNKR
jgi:hypothetical protein